MADHHDRRAPKVARVLEAYELGELGAELEARWTRETDRSSLRDLADRVNRALLAAALSADGGRQLPGEVTNYYRLLTDDEVTSGTRRQARAALEDAGVDIDALEEDFVSYQAVRTYLREYRDASPPDPTGDGDVVRRRRTEVQRLQGRLRAVTEGALSELATAGELAVGSPEVLVSVRVHCTDCGAQSTVGELFETGGCDCGTSRDGSGDAGDRG